MDNPTALEPVTDNFPLTSQEFREKISVLQKRMEKTPGTMVGDVLDEYCPLKHSFGDGVYVREIFMPKGLLVISKIHKFEHPYFVLCGVASVATEDGVILIKAPFQGMTKAGTKRLLYIHEDMVWITVHATKETDLKKIEEEIIAKDYFDLEDFLNKDIITITSENDRREEKLCLGQQ